jgi:hypothetical protein
MGHHRLADPIRIQYSPSDEQRIELKATIKKAIKEFEDKN